MFYAPGQDLQRPTHPRLHVRDARDAQILFEAVRRGILKAVSRRLNEVERTNFIQSGAVFVWEESDDELGLKRWTDGRVWSQSRMREPYLFYDEKLPNEQDNDVNTQTPRTQAIFRFVDGTSRGSSSSILSHFDRSAHRPPGLVKQAYSAYVTPAPGARTRKWHLTAYFTYADLQNLPTIDVDPNLRNMQVPPGVYRSGKARTRNSDMSVDTSPRMSSGGSTASSSPPSTPRRTGMSSPSASNYPELAMSPRFLPPLHTAVPHGNSGVAPRIASPQRETRCSEDQRVIQMLNSRSDR